MKAKLYRMEVGDSLTISHGWGGYLIWEMYLPIYGVVVNDHNGCFMSDCRTKGETIDIEIDDEYALKIITMAGVKKMFEEVNNEFFDMVKEKHKDITDKETADALKQAEEVAKQIKVTTTTTANDTDPPTVVKLEDKLNDAG